MAIHVHINVRDAGFNESDHPRASNGQFGSGGGNQPHSGASPAHDPKKNIPSDRKIDEQKAARERAGAQHGGEVDHRELGRQGKIVPTRGMKVGEYADYYDKNGDKQYGQIMSMGNKSMVIKPRGGKAATLKYHPGS